MDARIETLDADRRAFERLAEEGEALLAGQAIWLGGDPAPTLEDINRTVLDTEARQAAHRTEADGHRNDAEGLTPRIDGLRNLLGVAALLDPPDHALREKKLEGDHASALADEAEVSRCSEAAVILEDRLEALRTLPLTDQGVKDLESRLHQLTEDRHRMDSAIEAMAFVDNNSHALNWSDAPAMLEAREALAPNLKEQRDRANGALREAHAEALAADDAYTEATSHWQKADGQRHMAKERLLAAKQDLAEIGVPAPTEASVETAGHEKDKLEEEGRGIDATLADLNTAKGRGEKEREHADEGLNDAGHKVSAERKEADPADDRWERLQGDVAKHDIVAAGFSQTDSLVAGIRGHVNLAQEARSKRAELLSRLHRAGALHLLDEAGKSPTEASGILFADAYLAVWLAVSDWLRQRLPAQFADEDDLQEAVSRLRGQLKGLEGRLARQDDDLRGSSENIARGVDVQRRKARGQIDRLNRSLQGVTFGGIEGIRVKTLPVARMEQVLRALREGTVQKLLFQDDLPIEKAFDAIFQREGDGGDGGKRLLDYREYLQLQVEVRRRSGSGWEAANPTRLSTGEAIGVGAALMMVVLTEWERDATLLRGRRDHGSLRFLFLDEANRLSQDNLHVLFELCQTLDLQLLIAAPEVARADGNTTYHLVRSANESGREEVLVSGRRARRQE